MILTYLSILVTVFAKKPLREHNRLFENYCEFLKIPKIKSSYEANIFLEKYVINNVNVTSENLSNNSYDDDDFFENENNFLFMNQETIQWIQICNSRYFEKIDCDLILLNTMIEKMFEHKDFVVKNLTFLNIFFIFTFFALVSLFVLKCFENYRD